MEVEEINMMTWLLLILLVYVLLVSGLLVAACMRAVRMQRQEATREPHGDPYHEARPTYIRRPL